MAKARRSIFTDVSLDIAETLKDFREDFRKEIPARFMREQMTPRQFKQYYGVNIQQMKDLERLHGPEVVRGMFQTLKGGQNAGQPGKGTT